MELTKLAAKPQLIKIAIDDQETIDRYGEPLEFYIWDRQSMDSFVKLATLDYQNFGNVADVVKEYVLDSEGRPVITGDSVLPTDVMMKAITTVIETLGKSITQTGTNQTDSTKQS